MTTGRGARQDGRRDPWRDSPVDLFVGDRVQVQLEEGEWVSGFLRRVAGGLEIEYDEPVCLGGTCVESSRLLGREDAKRIRMLLRPEALCTDEARRRREDQIWEVAHPPVRRRLGNWVRELTGQDALRSEPLLRRHLGRRIVVALERDGRSLFASGLLLAIDADFLALADATLPAETSLPLCPGRMSGAGLDVLWSDDGLELFNRESEPVTILGIRTAEGLLPWEMQLKPARRESFGLPRAPAGTAELLFESPVTGDALLPRSRARVRGSSEGSVTIPALPDPSTRVGDLPREPVTPVEETAAEDLFERTPFGQ